MRKGLFYGIKAFAMFFFALFLLNTIGIRFFENLLYTGEGFILAFFFFVINGMFMRL